MDIYEKLSATEKTAYLEQEITSKYESDVVTLVENFKALEDPDDDARQAFKDDRLQLREKFLKQLEAIKYKSNDSREPSYHLIFSDLLSDIFTKQKEANSAAESLSERLKQLNSRLMLPKEDWVTFDPKSFLRQVQTLCSLALFKQLISVLGLQLHEQELFEKELNRLYTHKGA